MKNICVFCGSSTGYDPAYKSYAEELGKILANRSIGLVYGGGDVGLMGILSRTVMAHGGYVTGVIPEMLHEKVPHFELSDLKIVKDMHQRKALMYSLSDGFICLPGGIGSLEELLEAFTWLQLGYHSKPVCLVNASGYYSNLIRQFEFMVLEGFLSKNHLDTLLIKQNLEDIIEDMTATKPGYTEKCDN